MGSGPRSGPGTPRASAFAPEAGREAAASPAGAGRWRAPAGARGLWPWKLRVKSGGEGVAPHKPPKVKVRVTQRLLKDPGEFLLVLHPLPLIFWLDSSSSLTQLNPGDALNFVTKGQ